MPIQPLAAATELLGRESRLRASATTTVSYLMDLMYFGEFSIFEQVSSGDGFERVNLIGAKGHGPTDEALWLVSCFNTSVGPEPAAWASTGGDPFGARHHARPHTLHGLGANAGKVDIGLKILAASRFKRDELTRPIHVVALSGEEAVGSGVRALLETGPEPGGVALVHAPTNLELWTDHPGCVSIRLELARKLRHRRMPPSEGFWAIDVPGRSAHAQAPGLGRDAIARAREVLDQLRGPGDIRLLSIDAGDTANRVPGRCQLQIATFYEHLPELPPDISVASIADGTTLPFPIDGLHDAWWTARDAGIAAVAERTGGTRNAHAARPLSPQATGWLRSDRNDIAGAITLWTGPGVEVHDLVERFARGAAEALRHEQELEIAIQVTQDRPAFAGAEGAETFVAAAQQAMRAAKLPPVVSGGHHTSDAGLMRAAGMIPLVFGPGRGLGDLYRDDEAIPVVHLEAAYRFYVDLIQRWCVG